MGSGRRPCGQGGQGWSRQGLPGFQPGPIGLRDAGARHRSDGPAPPEHLREPAGQQGAGL